MGTGGKGQVAAATEGRQVKAWRAWTPAEDNLLIALRDQRRTRKEIARELGRTTSAVVNRIRWLRLDHVGHNYRPRRERLGPVVRHNSIPKSEVVQHYEYLCGAARKLLTACPWVYVLGSFEDVCHEVYLAATERVLHLYDPARGVPLRVALARFALLIVKGKAVRALRREMKMRAHNG